MKAIVRRGLVLIPAVVLVVGCAREPAGLEIQPGTDVSVEKTDGVTVAGRLVEVQAQEVVLQAPDGQATRVPRSQIRALRVVTAPAADAPAASTPQAPAPQAPAATAPPPAPAPDETAAADPERAAEAARADAVAAANAVERSTAAARPRVPEYRSVTIPAGTVLPIQLKTTVGSATSKVEDAVRGMLRRSIEVEGLEAIPAGAVVLGTVTEAERSGRVKGRARVAFRFTSLDLPGDAERLSIRTGLVAREAEATKKKDAAKIGGGAAAGAVIGGIIGGGDGAAKGAAIGGGAGTGVVLSTRGKEITVPAGTNVSVKLLEPVTIRIRLE
jgi:hypothetical protein